MTSSLRDKVVVVTGATRGCGRAIAVELGALGATVYCCGRTTRARRSPMNRPETIEETAELVDAVGGNGIAVRCDFTLLSDVDLLRGRLGSDVDGRLDVLVDDVWGGDSIHEFGVAFWESGLDKVLSMQRNCVETHVIALHWLLPLMVRAGSGLVVEVTDGDTDEYVGAGTSYYLVKCAVRALGRALAIELRPYGVVAMAVTPDFLRSEAMLEHFGVTEDNWWEASKISTDGDAAHFVMSETPRYLGRGVAALATDPRVSRFAGQTLASWTLMREYGFTDVDGSRPDFGRWMDEVYRTDTDPATVDTARYR